MAPRESSRPANRHRHRQGQSSRKDQHRKRRSQRPAPESSESRAERSSAALSAGALAQLDREYQRQKRRSERSERAERRERVERPERSRRRNRDEPHAVEREHVVEKPRKQHNGKKKRVVSGAILEEGRARSGLRGGRGGSEDSFEKEDYYAEAKPKKSRKKLCKESGTDALCPHG